MIHFSLHRRGVRVLCLWAVLLGAALCPFVFWQSRAAGFLFAALWLAASLVWLPLRAASLQGSASHGEVRVQQGLLFKTSRRLPTRWVTGADRFSTPLLALCGCCVLVVYTSGGVLLLPGLENAQADRLLLLLQGG